VEYFFFNQIGSSQMGNTMDLREINEKRYEIAAAQASAIMLIGLFSNLAILRLPHLQNSLQTLKLVGKLS
jgi:hypothetical protein